MKAKDPEPSAGTVAEGQRSKSQKMGRPFGDGKSRKKVRERGKGRDGSVGQLQDGESVMNFDMSSRHVYCSGPVLRSLTQFLNFQATLYDIE